MQKILSLVWFKIYPPHFGGQKGIALFNRELSRYYEVDCLCSENNEVVADAGCNILPELPIAKSQFINPFAWIRIQKQTIRKNYSWIILEFPYYAFVGRGLKRPDRKLIIHTHNIETERFRSFRKTGWNILRLFEKWSFRQADIIIFKTQGDREYAVKEYGILPSKTYILPYGIEKAALNKAGARKVLENNYGISPSEKILVFAGTLDYLPNTLAVRKIISEIIPRLKKILPEFRIIICGRNSGKALLSPEQSDDHLLFAGFVEDIEPFLAGADTFINTVENVHGIQTKILDAIAADTNVVCFEKAAFAIDPVVRDVKLFPVPDGDYDAFAEMVVKAVNLNFATPVDFFEKYSWQNLVKGFVSFLENVK
jgi:glycosyltransferase involved in cell wall biosynthesis